MGMTNDSLVERLRGRQWPEEQNNVIIGDYENTPYVRQGRVFSRALRMHQRVSEPIPSGESGVTSLCTAPNGKIYGATSGRRSHLFVYDPAPAADSVIDLGVLPGVKSVRRGLASDGRSRIFIAASEMENSADDGPLFVHDTAEDYSDEFRVLTGPVTQSAVPVPGEGIAAICADPRRKMIYGVSAVKGLFFRCHMDDGTAETIGPVSADRAFSRFLVMDAEGNVFGTRSLGELFRYSPEDNRIQELGTSIPGLAGREFYNALDTAVFNPVDGLIYGAGTADGVLFTLNPQTLEIRSLGKPAVRPRIRAISVAPDGRVFGVAGDEGGMGRLFCYHPARHELSDLGIMFAVSEVWRRGFEFDAACTGSNGEIYFGENERDGHLFLYFPSIVPGLI